MYKWESLRSYNCSPVITIKVTDSVWSLVNEEIRTEEARLQILNSEFTQSFIDSSIEIVGSAEEVKIMDNLIRNREDIRRRRELEENQKLKHPITGKYTDAVMNQYIRR